MPAHDVAGLGQLPLFALLGVGCGLLAVVIARGLFVVEHGFRRLPVPAFWHPVIGSLAFALVGLLEPRALGVGYDAIQDVIDGRLAVGAVATLLLAKLVAWWFALGSGTSGGTLAPILLIAGCFGHLVGAGVDQLVPGLDVAPGAVRARGHGGDVRFGDGGHVRRHRVRVRADRRLRGDPAADAGDRDAPTWSPGRCSTRPS